MAALIWAEGLSKTYRIRKGKGVLRRLLRPEVEEVRALCSVSFAIGEGELVGYIGPNGAGKSTTVKVLSGILVPDGGECAVMGLTPWTERKRMVGRIGVVFGQRSQLWWDLPVRDSFSLLGDIYRVDRAVFARTQAELVDRLSLAPLMETPVRQLSLGQRMRCELAASLLHDPKVLFLDEPTIGLDAVSKLAVREFILERNREAGMTVILTTHDMDDVEALCSRVLLIGAGRILMDGTVQALLDRGHERRLTATLERAPQAGGMPPGVMLSRLPGGEWSFRFDPRQMPVPGLVAWVNDRYGLIDMVVEHPPIDEVVARAYRALGGEGA